VEVIEAKLAATQVGDILFLDKQHMLDPIEKKDFKP
jgi:hypothetical protein